VCKRQDEVERFPGLWIKMDSSTSFSGRNARKMIQGQVIGRYVGVSEVY